MLYGVEVIAACACLMEPTTENGYSMPQVRHLGDLGHFSGLELLGGKPIWFTNPAFKNVNGTIRFVLSHFPRCLLMLSVP